MVLQIMKAVAARKVAATCGSIRWLPNTKPKARFSNVRYELLIAREENMGPGTTVYQRSGLIAPEHTIDTSLLPDSRYFWTVRAHFELDGRLRATEGGATRVDALGGVTAPSIHCYRFRKPK